MRLLCSGWGFLKCLTYFLLFCLCQIMSRGNSVVGGAMDGTGRNNLTIDVDIAATMSPTARMLVYFVTDNGEIVADSISFNVDDVFENKVSAS